MTPIAKSSEEQSLFQRLSWVTSISVSSIECAMATAPCITLAQSKTNWRFLLRMRATLEKSYVVWSGKVKRISPSKNTKLVALCLLAMATEGCGSMGRGYTFRAYELPVSKWEWTPLSSSSSSTRGRSIRWLVCNGSLCGYIFHRCVSHRTPTSLLAVSDRRRRKRSRKTPRMSHLLLLSYPPGRWNYDVY